jgi:hypothetical protein
LFGALAFTIGSTTRGLAYEVPLMYSSNQIDANLVPVELRSGIVLNMSLDGNGRITDCAFRNDSSSVQGDPASLQHQNIEVYRRRRRSAVLYRYSERNDVNEWACSFALQSQRYLSEYLG